MPLLPGSRLGPYEIASLLGVGGMGEVYRARDTRLGRDVAIKVLPQHLSGDAGRRERFEREARAISNLNHPHICTLYDVGSQDTAQGPVDFLVMEHIEGETLADRLLKGALPIDQVLRFAMEIADALDKAHRQGVIHRDLKPANVMLTKGGTKLLDFGLAKLTETRAAAGGAAGGPGGSGDRASGGRASEGALRPTTTRELTTAGTVLGTFQYMAPEQLEGNEADARTDIFAFGVLVYEMATGRKAFEGKSQASLIATILKEQPRPIAEMQATSPAGLDRVVRACLEKDPDDRVQTAHDVKMQLGWVADGSLTGAATSAIGAISQVGGLPQTGTAARGGEAIAGAARGRRGLTSWLGVAAAALLFGAATLALGWWLHTPPTRQVLRVNLQLPPKTQLDAQNASLALSPDGRTLAYAASAGDGKQQLWVRALDSLQAQPLAGTEDATYPFWSPDGKFLGFFADQKLKKVQAAGGTVQTLCDAQDGRGASWSTTGQIAFAPTPYGGLQVVSASGGAPAALTTPETEGTTHRLPHFLPDGKHLLFFLGQPGKDSASGINAVDLDSKSVSLVTKEISEGRFVAPGYLVFVREGNLLAQPMDPASLRLTGEAVPIAEKVQFNLNRWTGAFTFSDTGLFVYQAGSAVVKGRLTWFDMDGKEQGAIGEPASIVELALAPDEKQAAATVLSGAGSGTANIWLYDLVRGVGSRFTFAAEGGGSPIWSPDGRQVAYSDAENRIFIKAADGASEPRAALPEAGVNRNLTGWLPDGSGLLFSAQNPKTGFDIVLLPVAGDAKPRPILATAANEQNAKISPDGRWLLYSSDESGRREVYVASYPGPGGKWQVSPSGAQAGQWVETGKRIIYVDLDGKLESVEVTAQGGNLAIGAPRALFGGRSLSTAGDIAPDGKRMLLLRPTEETGQSSLVLVTDWTAGLQK